jgi:hypothetical protein
MTVGNYGTYPDGHVGCPRAQSDMTPCVARDGSTACADDGTCIGCRCHPADLLTELVAQVVIMPTEEKIEMASTNVVDLPAFQPYQVPIEGVLE